MNKHKDMVTNVTFVEHFQDEMVTEKNINKKSTTFFFWFQVGDNKISEICYNIQNFLRTSWAPIITTNGINFLIAGPLEQQENPC